MRGGGLSHLLCRATIASTATRARNSSSSSSSKGDCDASATAAAAALKFDSALKSVLLLLHPDAVHGHPQAERTNAEAFKELRQWSLEVGKGPCDNSKSGSSWQRRRRLSFFVRKRTGGGGGSGGDDNKRKETDASSSLSAVSATLPPPSAARLSKDPSRLLLPLMIAAGLKEEDERCLNDDDDDDAHYFDEERRRRSEPHRASNSSSSSSSSSFAYEDVDDATLVALKKPADFFAAASRASAARRARSNSNFNSCNSSSQPLLLDAARRRAAMRIVHGVTARYGEGFSTSSSSSSASSPSPGKVLEAVQRLAAAVEEFSAGGWGGGGGGDGDGDGLRGSTIFLVRRRRRRRSKGTSKWSNIDAATGAISLDVGDGDDAWRDVLLEAASADPISGSTALRSAAERRKEMEELAASALGVESVSLRLLPSVGGEGEEEEEEEDYDGDDDDDDDEEKETIRKTISLYDALVGELASAAPPVVGDSFSSSSGKGKEQHRRHAGVRVVVVGRGAKTTATAPPSTVVVRADVASAVDVFSAVESLGPALSSRHLESQRAERAAKRLLDAAAAKLGARELKLADDDGGLDGSSNKGNAISLPSEAAAVAAVAARILRAPESSGVAGIARKFPAKVEFYLGKKNAVSADGWKVTLGADFEA